MPVDYFATPGYVSGELHVQDSTYLNASNIGDDVAAPIDTLAIYCDTTFGSAANGRDVYVYLPATTGVVVDASTITHTGTTGALQVDTKGGAASVKGISSVIRDVLGVALTAGQYLAGEYMTLDANQEAGHDPASIIANIYMGTPVVGAAWDVGLYIEAGYDAAIMVGSPVLFSALIIAPKTDPTPYPLKFQLEGWWVPGIGTPGVYTEGSVIYMNYDAARTLTGGINGIYMNFSTNVTPNGQNIYGVAMMMPADVGGGSAGFFMRSAQDQGSGIDLDLDGNITDAQTLNGIKVNGDGVVLDAVGAAYRGIEVDQSFMTLTNYVSAYGIRITMPAVYGAGLDAAIYATGNGNLFEALPGSGVYVKMAEDNSYFLELDAGATWTQGRLMTFAWSAAATLGGAVNGIYLDFSTNLTRSGQVATGINMVLTNAINNEANTARAMSIVRNCVSDGSGGISNTTPLIYIVQNSSINDPAAVLDIEDASNIIDINYALDGNALGSATYSGNAIKVELTSSGGATYLGSTSFIRLNTGAGLTVGANNFYGAWIDFAHTIDDVGAVCSGIFMDFGSTVTTAGVSFYGLEISMPDPYVGVVTIAAIWTEGNGNGAGVNRQQAAFYGTLGLLNSTALTVNLEETYTDGTIIACANDGARSLTAPGYTGIFMDLRTGVDATTGQSGTIGINLLTIADWDPTATVFHGNYFDHYVLNDDEASYAISAVVTQDTTARVAGVQGAVYAKVVGNVGDTGGSYSVFIAEATDPGGVGTYEAVRVVSALDTGINFVDNDIGTGIVGTGSYGTAFINIEPSGGKTVAQAIKIGAGAGTVTTGVNINSTGGGMTNPILIDLEVFPTGTAISIAYSAAETLTGATTGITTDLSTNVTPADQAVIGHNIVMPANVAAASYGLQVSTAQDRGAAIHEVITSTGVGGQILDGALIDVTGANFADGTMYGIRVDMAGMAVAAGTVYGMYMTVPEIVNYPIGIVTNTTDTDQIGGRGIGILNTGTATTVPRAFAGSYFSIAETITTTMPGVANITHSVYDTIFQMSADAPDAITWSGSVFNFTGATIGAAPPNVSGDKINLTLPAGKIAAAANLTGYKLASSAILNDGGAANATHHGVYVDMTGVTTPVAGAANMLALYGLYVGMPAGGNVWGGGKTRAAYFGGGGHGIEMIRDGYGMFITMAAGGTNAERIILPVDATSAIFIDQATNDTTVAKDIMYFDIDAGDADGGIVNGMVMYIDETNGDGSFNTYNGIVVDMTFMADAPIVSNQIACFRAQINGTNTVSRHYIRPFYLDSDITIDMNTTKFVGLTMDFSGTTITSANTFVGIELNMVATTPNNATNTYGIKVILPTAKTYALYLDQGTNAATEKNLIYADIDCAAITAAAYFRGELIDIDETVVGNDGSFVVGYEVDMTGFATGRADLMGIKVLFDGTKSGGDITRGIYIDSDMILNTATENFYGIGIDLTGMTLTAFTMAAALKFEGTGPLGAWDLISAGTQATPLRQTAAGGNRFIEVVVQQESNALVGATLRGLAVRTSVAVDSVTGNIYSGEFQALNTDGTDIGVLTGVYIGVMGKSATGAATIGYMRGMEAVLTYEVLDTITNMRGIDITIRTRDDGIAIGTGYGLRVANEAAVGAGANLDAGIYVYTDVADGFDYGIDLSGCGDQLAIGDIKLAGVSGALPVAAVGNRGTLALLRGGAGVRDRLYICLKSDAGLYNFVEIANGGA